MQKHLEEIESAGGRVVAISYDSLDTLKRFARSSGITFPLLSDTDSKTIEAYGIRNLESAGSRIDGVPHPGTFIVDQKGIIRFKLFRQGYRDRHTVDALIKALSETRQNDPPTHEGAPVGDD